VPDRHDLTDEEWAGLQPLLPDRAPRHGGRWADDRQMINGVFFRTRTGTPWGDLPAVPRAAWLRSLRRVLTEAPNERFGNPSGGGVHEPVRRRRLPPRRRGGRARPGGRPGRRAGIRIDALDGTDAERRSEGVAMIAP
jgi:transposase